MFCSLPSCSTTLETPFNSIFYFLKKHFIEILNNKKLQICCILFIFKLFQFYTKSYTRNIWENLDRIALGWLSVEMMLLEWEIYWFIFIIFLKSRLFSLFIGSFINQESTLIYNLIYQQRPSPSFLYLQLRHYFCFCFSTSSQLLGCCCWVSIAWLLHLHLCAMFFALCRMQKKIRRNTKMKMKKRLLNSRMAKRSLESWIQSKIMQHKTRRLRKWFITKQFIRNTRLAFGRVADSLMFGSSSDLFFNILFRSVMCTLFSKKINNIK